MNPELLILEDDLSLGETLTGRLIKKGFSTKWAKNIEEANNYIAQNKFDLFILDVNLPDGSGFDLAKEIDPSSPVIFLTALNDAENRLKGYELGASDYIPKPFHLKELLIRIEKILPKKFDQNYFISGEVKIFTKTFTVEFQGQSTVLSKRDFSVLMYLIDKYPHIVSREELLNNVWGENKFPSQRTIDNTILRLRQSLKDTNNEYIKSIRGVGYQWIKGIENE